MKVNLILLSSDCYFGFLLFFINIFNVLFFRSFFFLIILKYNFFKSIESIIKLGNMSIFEKTQSRDKELWLNVFVSHAVMIIDTYNIIKN